MSSGPSDPEIRRPRSRLASTSLSYLSSLLTAPPRPAASRPTTRACATGSPLLRPSFLPLSLLPSPSPPPLTPPLLCLHRTRAPWEANRKLAAGPEVLHAPLAQRPPPPSGSGGIPARRTPSRSPRP